MSITLKGSPDAFAPAFNPLWYYFESTNKNAVGFRYVIDLYDGAGTPTLLHRYKIAPRPSDGYCEFNCSRVLSSYLGVAIAAAQFVDYDISVGEEYGVTWTYDSVQSYNNFGNIYNGYYEISDSAMGAHNYSVGDQIDITQDPTITNTAISGLHTVVAVPNAYGIVIDIPYTTAVANGGSSVFADGRKTIYPALYSITNKVVFQGAVGHEYYRTYTSTEYTLDFTNPGSAVSNHPIEKTVREGEYISLNFKGDFDYIVATNNRGDIWRTGVQSQANPITTVRMDPTWVLANCTTYVAGSGPIIDSDVEWYDVWVSDSAIGNKPLCYRYRFNIDRTCTNWGEMFVSFMDRLGSVGSFSFTLKNEKNLKISREEHTFMYGDLSGSAWTYATTDYGQKTINSTLETTYSLRTQWLSEEEAAYFLELMTSPQAYLNTGNGFFPVIVKTSSVKVAQRPQDKNLKYEIKLMLANNEIINV